MKQPTVIGFDADDTLWVNENYFREAEAAFCQLLSPYAGREKVLTELYEVELLNLEVYGFGIKGFMLSMVETATRLTNNAIDNSLSLKIIELGKAMLNKPVELLADVENILNNLQDKYRVILVTKGDLLDQQRKLEKSGLEKYFHHVEIMSNKKPDDYLKLVRHLDIQPVEFLMVGNSLRSDVLPIIEIGAQAIYVPYEITWHHESAEISESDKDKFVTIAKLSHLLDHLPY